VGKSRKLVEKLPQYHQNSDFGLLSPRSTVGQAVMQVIGDRNESIGASSGWAEKLSVGQPLGKPPTSGTNEGSGG
jgi:hypothetical protein